MMHPHLKRFCSVAESGLPVHKPSPDGYGSALPACVPLKHEPPSGTDMRWVSCPTAYFSCWNNKCPLALLHLGIYH